MWSVANSLELRGPKGWWLMRPNIAAALCCYGSSTPVFDKNTNHNTTVVPMAANIPFLSPSFQLSEIEKRIFGAFSIFSWSTSEASSSSLIWASSSRRTHPLLFFGSKVGKLEKGGILRLLSSSTKARQLSSWRREQRKGEKKREKRRWDYDRRFYWRKCQTPDQSNLLMLLSSRMHSGQNFLEKFHRWIKPTMFKFLVWNV